MSEILWLEQPECAEVARVGGKAANLSRLASVHPVPPGFCLTTTAYGRIIRQGDDFLIPPDLESRLAEAYAALGQRTQALPLRVAVRSSAVDEDGSDASFAGQFETFLNVVGYDDLVTAIKGCWASAQNSRVQSYRASQGGGAQSTPLAVLVQQLAPADISAVVFSANPVTGRRDEVVINASWGLGESIVGGSVTPDTVVVHKPGRTIVQRQIGDKARMTILSDAGAREVPVPRPMRSQPAVSDEQALEMADLAITLEKTMGWPVDVECAYAHGRLALLQCRPITTLPSGAAE